jgi:UDP-galactopyranose mutase
MNISEYKYVIVGSGFFGAVLAERIANQLQQPVLVLEKRNHIGGNCYSETDKETGIEFHQYGTHIFHTSNEKVWNYINKFTTFNQYRHQVLTTHKGKVYQMPINLETINSFYNLQLKPYEVESFLTSIINKESISEINSFEDKAISLVGRDLYEAFIKGYSEKHWQMPCSELPADLLKRLPFRKNYDESYYHSKYQGIPTDGYTAIFENMLANELIHIKLNTDFFEAKENLAKDAFIFYSGPIDKYFNYCYGKLNWRSLRFEKSVEPYEDYQGTAVMNFADADIPFTRVHEPKHLHPERDYHKHHTLTIKEYSLTASSDDEPYYPIPNKTNEQLIEQYKQLTLAEKNLVIAGRLGDYKYYDMHETIARALELFENRFQNRADEI